MLLIFTLDKTPEFLVGFALFIVKIDAFVLPPGRYDSFGLINPAYGKSIPSGAVVSE
jgi:hypothetical protein